MAGLLEQFRSKCGIGEYPVEYNPKIHGPYYPHRYYGKPDLDIKQVKLGELQGWLQRRNYQPLNLLRTIGRWGWKYHANWIAPKKAGVATLVQILMAYSLFSYINQYPRLRTAGHHHVKYHW